MPGKIVSLSCPCSDLPKLLIQEVIILIVKQYLWIKLTL